MHVVTSRLSPFRQLVLSVERWCRLYCVFVFLSRRLSVMSSGEFVVVEKVSGCVSVHLSWFYSNLWQGIERFSLQVSPERLSRLKISLVCATRVTDLVKVVALDTPPAWRILACQRWFTIFTLNFPVASLPNLGVSHHLVVNENCHLQNPMLGHIHWYSFTPWFGEPMLYWDTVQHIYPPEVRTRPLVRKAGTMTIRPLWLTSRFKR